jgi:hypothetical protein
MGSKHIYRRRIRIRTEPGEARADLEDDPHRYGVIVRHDGARVVSVEGLSLRTPWDLCTDAAAMLSRLVGMPLADDFNQVYLHTDGGMQCTHMFDMAGLAIAHAARGTKLREYDFEVVWSDGWERQSANMYVNGASYLSWTVQNSRILSPEPFAGLDLRTMRSWITANYTDPDQLEAVMLFRRAMHISGSRRLDLDTIPNAAATGHSMGACYVLQPGIGERAQRVRGATRNFGDSPDQMLKDLDGIA